MACTHASTHTLAADGGTHHANASPSSTHRTTKPYSSLSSRPLPHAPARPSRPLSLSSGQTSACEHTLFHVTRARALVYRACVGAGVWRRGRVGCDAATRGSLLAHEPSTANSGSVRSTDSTRSHHAFVLTCRPRPSVRPFGVQGHDEVGVQVDRRADACWWYAAAVSTPNPKPQTLNTKPFCRR